MFSLCVEILTIRYHDGYRAENLGGAEISMKKLFYPKWWLDLTGYFKNTITSGPGVILFAPRGGSGSSGGGDASVAALLVTAVVSGSLALVLGLFIGSKWSHVVNSTRREYVPIDL